MMQNSQLLCVILSKITEKKHKLPRGHEKTRGSENFLAVGKFSWRLGNFPGGWGFFHGSQPPGKNFPGGSDLQIKTLSTYRYHGRVQGAQR